MTDFEFQIDNSILYCTSRNLAKKTLGSTLSPESINLVLGKFEISRFHDYRNSVITKTLLDTGMRISEYQSNLRILTSKIRVY
ncbi:hypothetical protein [Paenibacillus sp. P46E]|uniref:hypothetical protein n=1 Tax=Paenibacillus sp. P46E TaxID=1349436 RepID=UPI000B2E7579|nr:hypothetical protein [Paenibacillus sp. P46E]